MGSAAQTARDELLYGQVKGGKRLNFGLCAVYVGATLLTVAFAIGIIALDKGSRALAMDIAMGVGAALSAATHWAQYKKYAKALDEIGPDPAGIDTQRTYSRETALVIASSRKSKDVLRQLWLAYGIMAVVMLAFGVFFLVLLLASSDIEMLFVLTGGVMWIGGLLLLSLAIRAFREWLMARRIEKLG